MKPYYEDELVTLHHGDCLEVMQALPDASVDAVVTDPPYGLGFMGRKWDSLPPGEPWARECLRVLKPGGHLLAFGGTRTWHRLACAVEDAGFEVRDSIAWLYGSGFPKSLDVSKAIDKAAGAEREVVGPSPFAARGSSMTGHRSRAGQAEAGYRPDGEPYPGESGRGNITAPATPDAERWQGWGTALKPAFEPVVVARKPLAGTVAANVLEHGTGALNIDGCRIGTKYADGDTYAKGMGDIQPPNPAGRWPTNVVLDESQAEVLDEQSGETVSRAGGRSTRGDASSWDRQDGGMYDRGRDLPRTGHDDRGGASRFFPTFRYQAKAPRSERPKVNGIAHPTVKPLTLISWLVRLVTPPGGTVLEPFAGSGTTVEAAVLEGFHCIAIEREADYLPLIMSRIHRRRDPVAQPTTLEEHKR